MLFYLFVWYFYCIIYNIHIIVSFITLIFLRPILNKHQVLSQVWTNTWGGSVPFGGFTPTSGARGVASNTADHSTHRSLVASRKPNLSDLGIFAGTLLALGTRKRHLLFGCGHLEVKGGMGRPKLLFSYALSWCFNAKKKKHAYDYI